MREVEARLRDKVRERAAELNVPPEILAPRRALDALLRLNLGKPDPRLPRELEGWRREASARTSCARPGRRRLPRLCSQLFST